MKSKHARKLDTSTDPHEAKYAHHKEDRLAKSGFTLDTCVVIEICKNQNVASLLSCRFDITDTTIHMCAQALLEIERLGYNVDAVLERIQKSMGVKIVQGVVTDEMIKDVEYLRGKCSTLHNGDDQILAYARSTCTTLVTKDKGLAQAAKMIDTLVINPDVLACDRARLRKKSKMRKIVDNTAYKPTTAKTMTKSFIQNSKHETRLKSLQ